MTDDTLPRDATAGEDLSGLMDDRFLDKELRHAAEAERIANAYNRYVFRARRKKAGMPWLTSALLKLTHREMFSGIWEWAGVFRKHDPNLGIAWHRIPQEIGILCADFVFWDSPDRSTMPALEVAAWLQNRLTRIHPFTNGNGRHARLITDVYLRSRRERLPRWPQIHRLKDGDKIRKQYIDAMREADRENIQPLVAFLKWCQTDVEVK